MKCRKYWKSKNYWNNVHITLINICNTWPIEIYDLNGIFQYLKLSSNANFALIFHYNLKRVVHIIYHIEYWMNCIWKRLPRQYLLLNYYTGLLGKLHIEFINIKEILQIKILVNLYHYKHVYLILFLWNKFVWSWYVFHWICIML